MITFKDGTSSAYRHSGKTSLPSSISGGSLVNRQYAVMAKIEDGIIEPNKPICVFRVTC